MTTKTKRRTKRTARPGRVTKPKTVFVIVPKTQMKAKTPAMLADPGKATITQVTTILSLARVYRARTGAWQHVKKHPELRKRFWYRRMEVPAKKAA